MDTIQYICDEALQIVKKFDYVFELSKLHGHAVYDDMRSQLIKEVERNIANIVLECKKKYVK